MCNCNSETTGRCWLKVDQITYERNVKRLLKGDRLAVSTFARLEANRLHDKSAEMVRSGYEQISADYCEQGGKFQSEGERSKALSDSITS